MRVTVLKEIPDDSGLRAAWNSLVLRMEHPEVFFTYEWALAARRAFGENLQPLLFLMHESERLAGVAALAIDRHQDNAALFLTASTADYCDVLSAPEERKPVLEVLLQEIKKFGLRDLVLANLPSDSSTSRIFPEVAKSCGFHFTSRAAYECAVIEFGNEQQRKDIVRSVSSKEREKRGLKKLAAVGVVQVAHASGPYQIEESLESIIAAHVQRFLATSRLSPLVHLERRIFLKELSTLLARAGWLKISQLEVNGEAVAWNYGFRFADSWFWYLPTFRTQYEDCSPGLCLLRLLVEEGCGDSSLRWLDLGLGDESYKSRFGNSKRLTCYVQLSVSSVQHAMNVSRQVLAGNVTRFPRIEKRLLQGRELTRASRNRIRATGITGTAAHAARRVIRSLTSEDEVLVFEAPQIDTAKLSQVALMPLTWELLAKAAMDHAKDASTLQYLKRCAQRMKLPAVQGYALLEQTGDPTHYLWVAGFAGFHLSEINHAIESDDPMAAMIFDCWTPEGQRGHGYYATAIRLAAANLQMSGKKAWIFSAAVNVASLNGILRARYEYRFSLVRKSRVGVSRVTRRDTTNSLPRSPAAAGS